MSLPHLKCVVVTHSHRFVDLEKPTYSLNDDDDVVDVPRSVHLGFHVLPRVDDGHRTQLLKDLGVKFMASHRLVAEVVLPAITKILQNTKTDTQRNKELEKLLLDLAEEGKYRCASCSTLHPSHVLVMQ